MSSRTDPVEYHLRTRRAERERPSVTGDLVGALADDVLAVPDDGLETLRFRETRLEDQSLAESDRLAGSISTNRKLDRDVTTRWADHHLRHRDGPATHAEFEHDAVMHALRGL